MAEETKKTKTAKTGKAPTAFEKECIEVIKQINEYKLACEANICTILYKNPDLLRETNLTLSDFDNNIWKVYFAIINDIIIVEKKNAIDAVIVGLYLEKHPKLNRKYEEYGGYDAIAKAVDYVKEEAFEGYVTELRKWNALLKLAKKGFPIKDRLSDYVDMDAEDIYKEFEVFLNDTFVNLDNNIKSYNGFEGMRELIDKMNAGAGVGIPFANCNNLNKEIGGMKKGEIIGIGASSGCGKSTLSINYVFPSMVRYNLRACFIINEENEEKFKKEALIWYCTNVLKKPISKYVLREGGYDEETLETLYKAADWYDSQKEKKNITIFPLEEYTSKKVVKIIKKYSQMGCDVIILDTLKESYDARNEELWKSMMRDTTDFYNAIKKTETAMVITYQLTKNRMRYLSNADIGVSKGIIDVFSVNIFCRRPMQDEYEGENRELSCYKIVGKKNNKIPFKLKKNEHYMILFISKNRAGNSDIQIVSEADFSINKFEDRGYCIVQQDY